MKTKTELTINQRYGLLCRFLYRGMKAKVEHFTGFNPFGEEMQAFDRIRKACHGGTPGVEGEHIFDILQAGDREPDRYAIIALSRLDRCVDDIELLLGMDVRSRFRQIEVAQIEEMFQGKPGTYLLTYFGIKYDSNEHTIA